MTQHYPHTCKLCRLQGSVPNGGKPVDVYLCCQKGTILFRWGREPNDYYASYAEHFPLAQENLTKSGRNRILVTPINDMWREAVRRGLIKLDGW